MQPSSRATPASYLLGKDGRGRKGNLCVQIYDWTRTHFLSAAPASGETGHCRQLLQTLCWPLTAVSWDCPATTEFSFVFPPSEWSKLPLFAHWQHTCLPCFKQLHLSPSSFGVIKEPACCFKAAFCSLFLTSNITFILLSFVRHL